MSKKIPIRKFSFRIIVFSVIIAGLSLLFQWLCPQLATPALPFIVLFFFVMTLFTMYIVLRSEDGQDGKKFVSSYMISRTVKILSCLLFLFLYIFLNREDAIRFAIAFMVIYFLFAIFEVVVLKKENESKSTAV
jgi:L-asparagine transporter-like permease